MVLHSACVADRGTRQRHGHTQRRSESTSECRHTKRHRERYTRTETHTGRDRGKRRHTQLQRHRVKIRAHTHTHTHTQSKPATCPTTGTRHSQQTQTQGNPRARTERQTAESRDWLPPGLLRFLLLPGRPLSVLPHIVWLRQSPPTDSQPTRYHLASRRFATHVPVSCARVVQSKTPTRVRGLVRPDSTHVHSPSCSIRAQEGQFSTGGAKGLL